MCIKPVLIRVVSVILLISVWSPPTVRAENDTYNAYVSKAASEQKDLPDSQPIEGLPTILNENVESFFLVNVLREGWYNTDLEYATIQGQNDIVIALTINGDMPFKEASNITLPRQYQDAIQPFLKDTMGNDIRPPQKETENLLRAVLKNSDGHDNNPYLFYLNEGAHRVGISVLSGGLKLHSLTFKQPEDTVDYDTLTSRYEHEGVTASGARLRLEGEYATFKSDRVLYPTSDKAAATSPSNPAKTLLNTIGQNTWKNPGQTLTWTFTVTTPGLYTVAFRVKQNTRRGMTSFRRISLDDSVPCNAFEAVAFEYRTDWYVQSVDLGNSSCPVFLDAGEHTLTMEAVTGPMAECYTSAEKLVIEANRIYRKILSVTGTSPDPYRDYDLAESIPGLIDDLSSLTDSLSDLDSRIEAINGMAGSNASLLTDFIRQLKSFIARPSEIPTRIDAFKGNITSLGTWVGSMSEQPLELDYIELYSPELQAPQANVGFFTRMIYRIREFLESFTADYSRTGLIEGTASDRKITVWVNAARDQTQIIRGMINDDFTPEHSIRVALDLVPDENTLLQATLAGKGPDAALLVTGALPVNLAKRGAVYNLEQFDGFSNIKARFRDSAMIKYRYQGGTYAVPNTQGFYMMFYRTDIFEEFDLDPPDTWADFYRLMPVLDHNNLQIGIPADQITFETLLYQHGGTFYTEELDATNLHTQAALNAFRMWTDLYVKYSLPLTFDFYNRFRTGEMPLGIADYSMYNTIAVLAPELRGLWKMVPVPGLESDQGINRTVTCDGLASVMMTKASDPESTFSFLEWWSSDEVQTRFGCEVEDLLGASGRYKTANIAVLEQLGWNSESLDALRLQWAHVTAVEQLPSSYDVSRNVINAFRSVAYRGSNVRETLSRYAQYMDDEIIRKEKTK